jgi:hypothetical protein
MDDKKHVYWHRELPPLDADPVREHVVEAASDHVSGHLTRHDEQWTVCYDSLMLAARERISQEVARLGGDCAHVLKETIDERHNDVVGDAWLHGRFEYMLFKRRGGPEKGG